MLAVSEMSFSSKLGRYRQYLDGLKRRGKHRYAFKPKQKRQHQNNRKGSKNQMRRFVRKAKTPQEPSPQAQPESLKVAWSEDFMAAEFGFHDVRGQAFYMIGVLDGYGSFSFDFPDDVDPIFSGRPLRDYFLGGGNR